MACVGVCICIPGLMWGRRVIYESERKRNSEMKHFLGRVSIACALVCGAGNVVAGDVGDTIITKLGIHKGIGDIVFISVDHSKGSLPACHTNTAWAFVLPITSDQDKKIYALLLAARATQTPVTLSGSGTCDTFYNVESLQSAFY